MQYGVLDAANVLIDRKPVAGDLSIKWRAIVVRICVAVEIPGRVDKCVHRVGFTSRRAAALRTRGVDEFRHTSQRRTAG